MGGPAKHGDGAPEPPEETSDMRADTDDPVQREGRRRLLEIYILDMRDKTSSSGKYSEFMSEAERHEFHQHLKKAEDWMHDTKDATKAMYVQKLDGLIDLGDLVVRRHEEREKKTPPKLAPNPLEPPTTVKKEVAEDRDKNRAPNLKPEAPVAPQEVKKEAEDGQWMEVTKEAPDPGSDDEPPITKLRMPMWLYKAKEEEVKKLDREQAGLQPVKQAPADEDGVAVTSATVAKRRRITVKQEPADEDERGGKTVSQEVASSESYKEREMLAQQARVLLSDVKPDATAAKKEEAKEEAKVEVENEVKAEWKTEVKMGVKAEETPGTKSEVKVQMKQEVPSEAYGPLDGRWITAGKQEFTIEGERITWDDGDVWKIEAIGGSFFAVTAGGMKYFSAELDDGKLKWSDGDMWTRLWAKVKVEVKKEVKSEVKVEVKTEVKNEAKMEIKQEVKQDTKQEVKQEPQQDGKPEPEESDGQLCGGPPPDHDPASTSADDRAEGEAELVKVKAELQDKRFDNPSSFAARLPMWIGMCIDFQKEKKTWAPSRPCCLPCFYQDQPAAPPRDELTACYHRLTKEQRREFREFIESGQSDHKWQGMFSTRVWDTMLHPELAKRRRLPKGPIKRRLPGPEWNCDLPWFEYELPGWVWKGHGWMLTADYGRRRVTPTCIAPGSEVFEGQGQVKVSHNAASDSALDPSAAGEQATAGLQPAPAEGDAPARERRPPAAGPAAPPLAGPAVPAGYARGKSFGGGKFMVVAKQSGVPGVCWSVTKQGWKVSWQEGHKGRAKCFPAARYQQPGRGPEAAEAAALQAAVAFRRELERAGQARAPKAAERRSGVPGVFWESSGRAWRVQLKSVSASGKQTRIQGGSFRPKDDTPEEVERARLLAVARLRELEREQGRAVEVREGAAAPRVQRQSGVQGVSWRARDSTWVTRYKKRHGSDKGRLIRSTFRPKDDSAEEVERARLAAVEELQKLREEDRAPGRAAAGGGGARGRRAGRGRA
ncbi:unnamed protein product [Prorocentrum cordatum]|uniref:AP2/ERF domain-containing protein n=1 Tax=Prorocentrum cordatum TaxID=2364126 RepID=A0ABN9VI38_9DINO|nr:unnamed protein product [Polarella glacialis]